jgi:hypothetical protein
LSRDEIAIRYGPIDRKREEAKMKARILTVVVAVMVLSVMFLSGQAVQAQVQPEALSAVAVENLFVALNEGDLGSAMATFAMGASAENRLGGQAYLDLDQIGAMLEGWQRDGREYEVLGDAITNVTSGLDIVTSEVEISDRGIAWGQQTVMAVVYDGQIQKLYVTGFRLTPSQYW